MGAEALLQYLWEHRLWDYGSLRTVDGLPVRVIDPGRRNNDAGPDFFNAKISINGQDWAGNVEIHVRASDWHRHHHDGDPAYESVMLHVVGQSDCRISRADGQEIPQVILQYTPDFAARYAAMVNDKSAPLACRRELPDLPPIYITDWLSALGLERLYGKVDRIMAALERLRGDWQEAAYVTLARALGFSTNSDAFERLAFATPLGCLLKHRSEPSLVEATLFGQSGFLNDPNARYDDPEYVKSLLIDYGFMRAKFSLETPGPLGWKMARMRPPNFPHRRIAALAAMIADGFRLGRSFNHIECEADARALFNVSISGYWANHYTFGSASAMAPRAFSPDTVTSLLINAVVPLLYAYGLYFGNDSRCEAALAILQGLPPEHNSLTRVFTDLGIPCDDAYTSQAMIQLRRAYCEPRKCLYCRLGHRFLAAKAKP